MTRTSVLKRVSAAGFGSYSRNLSITCAFCHAGSSVLPSSTGAEAARVEAASVALAAISTGIELTAEGGLLTTFVGSCAASWPAKITREDSDRGVTIDFFIWAATGGAVYDER